MTTVTKEQINNCKKYARTMMMMAKLLEEKYGIEDAATQSYVRQGIDSCKMALKLQHQWDLDRTVEIQIPVAA